ncbi:uncharacterized protein LOC144139856 [Haemaphysalis longicornis]
MNDLNLYQYVVYEIKAGAGGLAASRSGRRGTRGRRAKDKDKEEREKEGTCVALECAKTARSKRSTCDSYYPFPRDKARLRLWVAALRRRYWTPTRDDRLCSRHFMSGRRATPKTPTTFPRCSNLRGTSGPALLRSSQPSKRQRGWPLQS